MKEPIPELTGTMSRLGLLSKVLYNLHLEGTDVFTAIKQNCKKAREKSKSYICKTGVQGMGKLYIS